MTPHEMADWLEGELNIRALQGMRKWTHQRNMVDDIAAFLRALPTEAQKIEALKWATAAGGHGRSAMEMVFEKNPWAHHEARDSARGVRRAMRILGINPDAPRS